MYVIFQRDECLSLFSFPDDDQHAVRRFPILLLDCQIIHLCNRPCLHIKDDWQLTITYLNQCAFITYVYIHHFFLLYKIWVLEKGVVLMNDEEMDGWVCITFNDASFE